jgi:hypothetical protein
MTYKKINEVKKAKIKEWVIPLCENMKSWGNNIPIPATNMVSKSSEIPPKAPDNRYLLLIKVNMIKGTKKWVNKSIV